MRKLSDVQKQELLNRTNAKSFEEIPEETVKELIEYPDMTVEFLSQDNEWNKVVDKRPE